MNKHTEIKPRIYVACLAAYNNGHLHGKWIDADQESESIRQEIKEMLSKSPIPHAEEFAIHDYEGFEGIRLSEHQSIDSIVELAKAIAKHGQAYAAYAGYFGLEYATEERFEDAYNGEWESEEAFAEDLVDETMDIPDNIRFYFDYEKFARDLFINDFYSIDTPTSGVYVFRHC